MEKILTVVIPTYNMEGLLDKCLRSLVMPRNMDLLEVLVVNDGSKDNSLEIARRFEARYPDTFVVIDKENGNYGSCINRGLKEASGKYFKVLDADDTYDTENFCEYIDFLKEQDETDLVMSDFLIIDQKEGTTQRIGFDLPVGTTFTFDYFAEKNVPYMWMHGVTHLTQKLRKIDYHQLEGISYTDKEVVFYPMAVSRTVAYFPKVVYQYLMGREGQTIDENVWVKNYWMEEKAVKKLLDLYKQHKEEVGQGGKLFMQLQARLYVTSIYRSYLQKLRGRLPIDNLLAFDQYLESSDAELYHDVESETEVTNFHFIRVWRKYKRHMKRYLLHRALHRVAYYIGIRRH